MHYKFYISKSTQHFGDLDLLDMLKDFRKNNHLNQVTGMLFYRAGHFLQVIEGEKHIIETLYSKIARDSRHIEIRTLLEGDIGNRMFGHWDMAYKKIEDIEEEVVTDVDQIIDTYKKIDFLEEGIILKVIKGFYYKA